MRNRTRDRLQAVERRHPRWHCWQSNKGMCWAVRTANFANGSGVTVDGATPALLEEAIVAAEEALFLAGAA
jgi:hypothetical protein